MPRYKILPHTADMRLKLYGKDLEELLINGTYGLAKILYEDIDKKKKLIRGFEKVETESVDRSSLVVDYLNDVLSLSNIEKQVYPKSKILKLSDTSVVAHVSGVEVDHFDEDVKAVSYHEADIEEGGGNLEITLTLDI